MAVLVGVLAWLVVVAASAARAQCINDAQGNDDEPGQKDLSQFCDFGTCNVSDASIGLNFDDTSWPGNNTGDACFLYDTDGDGFVNRVVCATVAGAGTLQAGSPKCYTCSDTRPDRCTGSTLVTCTSTCTAAPPFATDPFAGEPTHFGNKCAGSSPNCRFFDTRVTCCVTAGSTGGGTLIDACSYPSQNPNSDPSDCVVTRECGNDPNDPVCNDSNPCTVDTCDTGVGVCRHVAGNQGAQCRGPAGICDVAEVCDGTSFFCPADQFAVSGVCRNASDLCDVSESCDGSGPDCPADGVAQQGTLCRADTGQCDVQEVCDGIAKTCPPNGFEPNNTPCSDGSECTTGDVCTGGTCVGGPAPNCNDNNDCTTDTCDPQKPGGCVNTNNNDPCSDNSECTTNDACSNGACVGGPPPNCDDGLFCTTDTCDPQKLGGCVHDPVPGPCCDVDSECVENPDDNCTQNERCENHACVSDPVDCNDNNDCTTDTCDPQKPGGCVNTNNNDPCSDSDECTTNDACSDGACVGGPPPNCNDNNVCTTDTCDPQKPGGCVNTNNNDPCNDSDECTTNDACSNGACVGGPEPNCDDNNVCTTDTCDSQKPGGCVNTNNTGPCDDGNGCTVGDVCSDGICTSGAQKDCNDFNECTDDTCLSPSGDCQNLNNAEPCDDGNVCTVDDRCGDGDCQPGAEKDCNDHLDCTTDFCTPTTDCQHEPVPEPCCDTDAECADSDGCTTNERCVNNACVSDPVTCDDGNKCTIDTCNNDGGDFLCNHENCILLAHLPDPAPCPDLTCFPPCGNFVIEPEAGETCDPPDPTPLDPNFPLVPRCRDDCTFCTDGHLDTTDGETCDDGNTVSGCKPPHFSIPLDGCQNNCTPPVCKDPSKVVLAQYIDRFTFHGRLPATSTLDFASKAFVVELTNPSGRVLYRASVPAGAITDTSGVLSGPFRHKNLNAKLAGGIADLKIKTRRGVGYEATLKAYGNLYLSQSEMMVHVYSGTNEWTVSAVWEKRSATSWVFTGK
jgi:hypothetical protein